MPEFLYCLNSSTIKPTPILQKIAIAGETGYSAIELWHDDIDLYLDEGGSIQDIRKALADHQLTAPTTIMVKGWCDTTGEEYEQGIAECKRRMEQSAEVGAEFVIAGPPHGQVDIEMAARRYGDLMEIGLEIGVKPAMEYLGFAEQINTIDDALQIMDGSEKPEVTIVLDPFHCFRGGGGMESMARLTGGQIAISHFNDAPADPPRETQRDPDRVLPGEGIVDLKRYIELLRQTGYDRWISLELFRQDLWDQDAKTVAKLGLEKMREVVEG